MRRPDVRAIGRTATLSLIALLAACATPTDRAARSSDLVGSWVYADVQADATSPVANSDCETDFGVIYDADGRFSGYEETGIWRIEGDHLIETVTETWEMGGGDEVVKVAAPAASRIRLDWKSPDIVNLIGDRHGDGYALIRCRPYVPDNGTSPR